MAKKNYELMLTEPEDSPNRTSPSVSTLQHFSRSGRHTMQRIFSTGIAKSADDFLHVERLSVGVIGMRTNLVREFAY